MAEIGIAASLLQIAGAGIQLTRTLYEFASTTAAAREQVDYIGKNVSFYADVLELLVEQFEQERPLHSRKAISLAEKVYDHSYDLFNRIKDLIPDRRRTRDQISFIQRIAWNFKKTKVALLVGELENLKSTVQLLVQVLCAARQIRAYKEDTRRPSEKFKKREAARRQYLRAENVLVEWQRTQESLPLLQKAAERDDLYSVQAASGSKNELVLASSSKSYALVKSQSSSLAIIEAATAAATSSESDKRALVLRNTKEWLEMLIDDWTLLPQQPLTGREDSDDAWRGAPASAERGVSLRSRSRDLGADNAYVSTDEIQQRLNTSQAQLRRAEAQSEDQRGQRAPTGRRGHSPPRRGEAPAHSKHNGGGQGRVPASTKMANRYDTAAHRDMADETGGNGRSKKRISETWRTDQSSAGPRKYHDGEGYPRPSTLASPSVPFRLRGPEEDWHRERGEDSWRQSRPKQGPIHEERHNALEGLLFSTEEFELSELDSHLSRVQTEFSFIDSWSPNPFERMSRADGLHREIQSEIIEVANGIESGNTNFHWRRAALLAKAKSLQEQIASAKISLGPSRAKEFDENILFGLGPGKQPMWEPSFLAVNPPGIRDVDPLINKEGKLDCPDPNCNIKGSRGFFSMAALDGHRRNHLPPLNINTLDTHGIETIDPQPRRRDGYVN